MLRLAELVRDLFDIQCSPTQARRRLLLQAGTTGGSVIGMDWPASAYLLKASGEKAEISPQHKNTFSLEELQTYVGGYIEPVWLPGNRVMFVNEEGRLQELPLNAAASAIAQRWIVGDVVYCDRSLLE